MYLTGLQIEGFRGALQWSLPTDQAASTSQMLPLPKGRAGCAVADAITLFAAALTTMGPPEQADPSLHMGLFPASQRLGWAGPATSVVGQGLDAELQGLRGPAVASLVAEGSRALTIEAVLALDPPLFGRMREHALRDPRMVTALGQNPGVRIKVGWLFSKNRENANPSVLFLRVGDVGFELSGKERPAWVPDLFHDLGRRFARTDPFEPPAAVARQWLDATLSPDPKVRRGIAAAHAALCAPPFDLPALGLVRDAADDTTVEIVFGEELARVRQLGRPALDAMRIVYAAYVLRPDVLLLDEPIPPEQIRWLTKLTEADEAPVEQIWHG